VAVQLDDPRTGSIRPSYSGNSSGRSSEDFARSLGVNDYKYKLIVFTFSAMITGITGALYAHYVSVVTPKILGNEFFLMVMLMLSVGGTGKFPGAVLGAFIITISNEILRDAGQYRLLILGSCVVLTILYLPDGIVQLRDRINLAKRALNSAKIM
jgi:branched-chain amino acid transport system permease protein